jgi:hypothetical protein
MAWKEVKEGKRKLGNIDITVAPSVVELRSSLNADYFVKYICIEQNSTQQPILVKTI